MHRRRRRRRRRRSYAWDQPIRRGRRGLELSENEGQPEGQAEDQPPAQPGAPAQEGGVEANPDAKPEEPTPAVEPKGVEFKNKDGETVNNFDGTPIMVDEKGNFLSKDPKGNPLQKDAEGNPIILLADGTTLPADHIVHTDGKVYKKGEEPVSPEMQKVLKRAQTDIYGMLYDSAKRGNIDKLQSDSDIGNALFEGSGNYNFLEFTLKFKAGGLDNVYEQTRVLEDNKDSLIEEIQEKETEEPRTYNMTMTEDTDSNVVRLVESFGEDDVFNINMALGMAIGEVPVDQDEKELKMIEDTVERVLILQDKIDKVELFLKDFTCDKPKEEGEDKKEGEGEGEEKEGEEGEEAEGEAEEAPAEEEAEAGPEERILSAYHRRSHRIKKLPRWLNEEEAEEEAPAEEEAEEKEGEEEGEEKEEGASAKGKEDSEEEEEEMTPKECKEIKAALENGMKKWAEKMKEYHEFLLARGLPIPKKEEAEAEEGEEAESGEEGEEAEGEEGEEEGEEAEAEAEDEPPAE